MLLSTRCHRPFLLILCIWINVTYSAAITCLNGNIDGGSCKCFSCWQGETCSDRANSKPVFADHKVIVYLQKDHLEGMPVYVAEAFDADEVTCADSDDGCQCATVDYTIASQEGGSNFWIDKDSGELLLLAADIPLFSNTLQLAASDGDDNTDTMTLEVIPDVTEPSPAMAPVMMNGDDSSFDFHPLHRQKRSASLPSEVTFDLVKTGANENETTIKVGTRIQFKLDILFPLGQTDIQVELFTPDTNNVIMMLCNVNVVKGSNLGVTGTTTPQLESRDNNNIMDRAIINLDVVDNTGTDLTSNTPSTLTVTYEAVMTENSNTADNTEYWVSAGAEYNNSRDIWVGQASFTTSLADDTASFTTDPVFNFTGPSELAIGSSSLFFLEVMVPYPSIELKVDVFAAINVSDAMSICSGKLIEVSDGYTCGFGDLIDYQPQFYADGNTNSFGHINWDLGKPLNKLAREVSDVTSHKLSFGVVVRMEDDESLVGGDYVVGASVEIASNKIWAGKLTIRAAAKAGPGVVTGTPTFNMGFVNGVNDLSKTKPAEISIDIVVPPNSEGEYKVEVQVPRDSDEAVLQLCSLSIISVGINLGCLDTASVTSEYIRTSPGSKLPDRVIFNLGTVRNIGDWGTYTTEQGANRNTLSLLVPILAADHPATVSGSSHQVTLGLYYGNQQLSIGTANANVINDHAADAITSANTPTFDLVYNDGSSTFHVGATGLLTMEISLARDNLYAPFHVEFIMPNNSGTSMLSICKVRLTKAGHNLPCMLSDTVDKETELVSSFGDNVTDRSYLHLSSLYTKSTFNDTEEDKLQMSVIFKVLDHPGFTADPKTWISGGVRYSDSHLWVGQKALFGETSAATYTLDDPPHLEVVADQPSWPGVPHGYPAKYLVRIKMNPNQTSTFKLDVSTTSNALSVCSIKFAQAGDSYYCMDYTAITFSVDQEDTNIGIIKSISYDLGAITNHGENNMVMNSNYDENTIELEVIVAMTTDIAVAADQSTHDFNVVLTYDTTPLTVSKTVTVKTEASTTFVQSSLQNGTTATAAMGSISGTDVELYNESLSTIVLGEAKRVIVELTIPADSVSELLVEVMTPTSVANIMNVDYVGVLDAGVNLPCVRSKQTSATYMPRPGSQTNDVGTLTIPYVCNVGVNSIDASANKLRVEGIIRLLPKAAVAVGDVLRIHTAVTVNKHEIGVFDNDLTVADDAAFVDIYPLDVSFPSDEGVIKNITGPLTMSIGEVKVVPIVFVVPSYTSSMVFLDIAMPTNDSHAAAMITVNKAVITRSGRNLPDLTADTAVKAITLTSAYNTSQMTKAEINLGILTNAGVMERLGEFHEDDNTFTVEFTFQMADHDESANGVIHLLSFGLHVAKFVCILEEPFTVQRTGSESLVFNVSSSLDEVNSTLTNVVVDSILALDDTSTLEGRNFNFYVFIPPYMEFVDSVITSPHKQFLSKGAQGQVITFELGPLYFTDEVRMTTTLMTNASYLVPVGVTGMDSVLTYQAVSDSRAATDLTSDMDYLNFTVTTTPQTGVGCVPTPLGMESSVIQDCQISASRDSLTGFEAHKGRYNAGAATGWTPFVHSGKVREERYIQVYFGNKVMVNSLSLQQDGQAKAKAITIRHSDDGLAWVENSDNKISVDDTVSDQEVTIPSPKASRYIRVMMTELNSDTQAGRFRFEFNGCATTSDAPTDLCAANVVPATMLSDFKSRTFLVTTTHVFVCDGRQGNLGIEQRCFSSPDGDSWAELDPRVGSIIGYDNAEPRVYGVSSDGLVYMSSEDGSQWETSVTDDVTTAKGLATYKAATEVPLTDDANLSVGNPHASYTDGVYGATSVGLKKNSGAWSTVFDWSATCCP